MRIGRRRRDDERGAISVMAAMMTLASVLATSLAVDVGRVAYVSRDQQGVTDRAALDTIYDLRDHDAATLSELFADASAVVDLTMDRNPGSNPTAAGSRQVDGLVLGTEDSGGFAAVCGVEPTWMQDQRTAAGQSQVPDCTTADSLGTHGPGDISAVEVFTTSDVPFLFAIGSSEASRTVNKRARASFGNPIGTVSAASTAVDLNDGLATNLLSRLLGADADLDLVGWNGLANTSVTLRQIGLQLGAGSLDQVLDTQLTVAELASVLATLLSNNQAEPDANAQATLADIAALTSTTTLGVVRLGDVLTIDPESGSSAMDASLDPSSLLAAVGQQALVNLSLANGDNFATVDLEVPGLTSVQLKLIEGPQIAVGRPGKDADGNWITQATTSQTRLDVELPLGAAAATVAGAGTATATLFRDEIAAISSCTDALYEGSSDPGSLRSRIKESIDAYEQAATLLGVTVSALMDLVDATLNSLGTLVGTLGCLLTPSSTRTQVQDELYELVDQYEALVGEIAGAVEDGTTTLFPDPPVLRIALANGSVALDTITCTDPLGVGTVVEGSEGRVVLTSTSLVAADPLNPDPQPITLLDLDLGRFGELAASLSADVDLGTFSDTHDFVGPFPSDGVAYSSDDLALESVLDLMTLTLDPARVLGLPVNALTDRAVTSITNVLSVVLGRVDNVLDRTLDVLGLDLGVVEARVLGATCEGPPRLLANPIS